MQCPRSCPGAATHRTTLQGTPLVPINAHPCPAGHPALRMPPPRALHLRHSGPDDQQPAEMSSEAGSATTTLPMQPRQHPHQYQRSVGDAMWTVWSGTQQFAGNVLSSWSSREASVDNVDNAAQSSLPSTSGRARLLKDAAESGKTADRTNAAKPTPNLEPFLKPVGVMETRYIRMLSNLCGLSYQLDKVTTASLQRRHRLDLVTTSQDTHCVFREMPKSALQVFAEADAMAVSPLQVQEARDTQLQRAAQTRIDVPAPVQQRKTKTPSPTELVAAKLYEAAAAAASAAAPLANNISTFTTTVVPVQTVASTLQTAAAAGQATAVATIATVTAAIDATWSSSSGGKDNLSPTEWFVADDEASATRYFVIMGSDTIEHWRTNITFDPVVFEDAALGAKVHRGVYEAALVLYERFLPLVEEHVRANPFAKLAFTGHSLGGSIATLLVMMYVHRGVISPVNLAPTYTFGAPAVFCEGCCGGETCDAGDISSSGPPRGLDAAHGVLARVGLKESSVKNVVMHKDIVPRAFACDYSSVADILKRVGDSFRDHCCLAGPTRQAMYFPVGRVMVLQPSTEHSFVRPGEAFHPSLPQQAGLFLLRQPTSAVAARAAAVAAAAGSDEDGRVTPRSLTEAVNALMDTPHPLDILGDTESYGNDGGISRYHNPDNYTRALGRVLCLTWFWRTTSFGGASGVAVSTAAEADAAAEVPRSARQGRPFPLFEAQEQL